MSLEHSLSERRASKPFPREAGRHRVSQDALLRFIRQLVRIPSQGGIDPQGHALSSARHWLERHQVPVQVLRAPRRKRGAQAIGLLAEVRGDRSGPTYCLAACLDTAPTGLPESWLEGQPFSGATTNDGWLIGRGSADSKAGVAIYSAIIAELASGRHSFAGRLLFLADSDEHTGRFGAVKELVRRVHHIDGVYIGYAGNTSIKVGSRGFYRARVKVYGVGSHSGSRCPSRENAIVKAARLVEALNSSALPSAQEAAFPLPPQITVTGIEGGRGYSNVPDFCIVRVDYRLTPTFTKARAREHLQEVVNHTDAELGWLKPSNIESEQSWPAYSLDRSSELVRALANAAGDTMGRDVPLEISGPSNVGNYLQSIGIPATAGFGVNSKNIHAADEGIEIQTIMPAFETYWRAICDLLSVDR